MKRFYKTVSVSGERGILLDARAVRTPKKSLLTLPNDALARGVADEWRAQGDKVNPATMRLTGLANAAIDVIAPDTANFAASLAVYGESELLCYRAGDPPELVARQNEIWDPILAWARTRYDVAFTLVTGIMHQPQPPETVKRLAAAIASYAPFQLAALSPIVAISGSLVIALGIAEGVLEPEAAFDAAHLDELWQAQQWGEDDFALKARAVHRRDFLSGCQFLRLYRDGQEPAR